MCPVLSSWRTHLYWWKYETQLVCAFFHWWNLSWIIYYFSSQNSEPKGFYTELDNINSKYHEIIACMTPSLVVLMCRSISLWLSGLFENSNSKILKGSDSWINIYWTNKSERYTLQKLSCKMCSHTSFISLDIALHCIAYCFGLIPNILSDPNGTRCKPSDTSTSQLYKSCSFCKNELSTSWSVKNNCQFV